MRIINNFVELLKFYFNKNNKPVNRGVIVESQDPNVFRFGANDNFVKTRFGVDWSKYVPEGELQKKAGVETMGCVSFSALDNIETLFNFFLECGYLTPTQFNFLNDNGYIVNGRVNFSDRFTAKMSGTSSNGNTLSNVANSVRHDGLVPEALWPFNEGMSLSEYYSSIPQSVIELGKKFADTFDIGYEFVLPENYDAALAYGPIQVIVHAWNAPRNGKYWSTVAQSLNHAVLYFVKNIILDHYNPFQKKMEDNFNYGAGGYLYVVKNAQKLYDHLATDHDIVQGVLAKLVAGVSEEDFTKLLEDDGPTKVKVREQMIKNATNAPLSVIRAQSHGEVMVYIKNK